MTGKSNSKYKFKKILISTFFVILELKKTEISMNGSFLNDLRFAINSNQKWRRINTSKYCLKNTMWRKMILLEIQEKSIYKESCTYTYN